MHKIKIILISLFAIIAIVVAILAFILSGYNNRDYQQLLSKTVDNFTDYTLSIKGHFELDGFLTPVLSASNIELHSKIDKSFVRIGNFKIQLALAHLLNDTILINDLLVENMQIKIQTNEKPERSENLFSYLPIPVIEHAELKNIQLLSDTDNQTHKLNSFTISSSDRLAPLEIHSTGTFGGHVFDIKGQLGSLEDIFNHQKSYPVNLLANWQQAQLLINGTIDNPSHGRGLDLMAEVNVPDMAELVEDNAPINAHLQGKVHVKGSFVEPELADIQFSIVDKPLIDLGITGSIGNLLTQEQMALHLSGTIHDEELLKWIMPDSSPVFNGLSIEADIVESHQSYILQNIDINLHNDQGLKINLTGTSHVVMQEQPFRFVDLQATLSTKDTATIKPYIGDFLPEMGAVHGTARITTQAKNFVLSHIDLVAGVDNKVQLVVQGKVGPLLMESHPVDLFDNDKIALDISLKAEYSADLTSLLNIDHPEIGSIAIIAKLNGTFEKIKLENIKLKAGSPDILSIQADGWVVWDKLGGHSPEQSADIIVQAKTPSIQNAARLYGENFPDLGVAKSSIRIHGNGKKLEGSDLSLQIGAKNSLLIAMQGKVAQLFAADLFYKGIELTGSLTGKSTRYLSGLAGNSSIPDIGAISGKFTIRGNSNHLRIPQLSLSAGRKKQLQLTASGKIAAIPLQQGLPKGVDIALTLSAPSSADLSLIAGSEIPDLGRLLIKGRLVDEEGIFAVRDLTLTAGDPQQATISMSGAIEDVLSTQGLQLSILFDEKTLQELFDLPRISELGQLKGSAVLSNAKGKLSIKGLKIESGASELIDLKVLGAIDNVSKAGQISANVEFSIKQPELFGKLFAVDLSKFGSVSASGHISGDKNQISFKGHSFIGRTKVTSDLALSFNNENFKIYGEINSPNIFLEDFGIISSLSTAHQASTAKAAKKILFSNTPISLDFLQKLDLDLKLRLFKMTGIDYQLDRVAIDLLLDKGQLTGSPIDFDLSGGHITMKAEINTSKMPKWQLRVEGDNIQLGKTFKEQNNPLPINGDLNFVIDLNSSGASAHEIAANLTGGLGFTLENGGIDRSQLELAFLNPLGWLFSHGISGNEFRISCGLGRYQVRQGIIRSKVFLINGPKLFVRGKTEINLANETINSFYNLEKKNIFDNTIVSILTATSVPIKISGNLSDPIIEQAAIPSVVSKADRYIFAPVVTIPQELLGTVFGFLGGGNNDEHSPCKAYIKN